MLFLFTINKPWKINLYFKTTQIQFLVLHFEPTFKLKSSIERPNKGVLHISEIHTVCLENRILDQRRPSKRYVKLNWHCFGAWKGSCLGVCKKSFPCSYQIYDTNNEHTKACYDILDVWFRPPRRAAPPGARLGAREKIALKNCSRPLQIRFSVLCAFDQMASFWKD